MDAGRAKSGGGGKNTINLITFLGATLLLLAVKVQAQSEASWHQLVPDHIAKDPEEIRRFHSGERKPGESWL